MAIESHNVYENVRTRVIVLHQNRILLLPTNKADAGWQVPGGGLEPHESIAECAEREVIEETGIKVKALGLAFIREWVVPKYCPMDEVPEGQFGYGMEVFMYAVPTSDDIEPHAETSEDLTPIWYPLAELDKIPLWPKQLRVLARDILAGRKIYAVPTFPSQLESPWAEPSSIEFGYAVPTEV